MIRSFDVARDGEAVADLIEDAFALKNDPDGQFVLVQMRENARKFKEANWVPPPGTMLGFVWEVEGKLAGNISLIPHSHAGAKLHLIANVAVAPDFRGQGIAKALTSHALQYSRKVGAREVWLQVKRENDAAIGMYTHLGFEQDHCLDVWKKEARLALKDPNLSLPLSGAREIRNRVLADWKLQKEWLERNYPPATRWYSPMEFGNFSPWAWLDPIRWLNLMALIHHSLCADGELAAVLSCQRTALRTDNLYLALPESPAEDENAEVLLRYFLQESWSGKPLTAEYPAGRAARGFENAGFRLARTLLWMRIKI